MRLRLPLALLAVVVLAGGALRFAQAADPDPYQSRDEQSYVALALGLVRAHQYTSSTASDPFHWPPGAPLAFAIAHRLHVQPTDQVKGINDLPSAYWLQAVVSTLTILAAFALATVLAGQWAGLAAATLVAFYPPFVRGPADLLSEPLGGLLATLTLLATALALKRERSWPWLLAAGVAAGATILTRADLALLPGICALVVAVAAWRAAGAAGRRASVLRALRAAVPLLAGTLVLLLPWTAYASTRSHRLVLLSSGGESNLFIGTYLPGGGRLYGVKKALEAETKARYPQFRALHWSSLPQNYVMKTVAARHPELSESAALSREARHNLRAYALGDPISFAGMMLSKMWRLWGGYPVGGAGGERTTPQLALHLAIMAFGVVGLAGGLAFGRRPVLWLLVLPLLYVSVLNGILVSESRHNLTLMPVVMVGGAAGIAAMLARRPAGGRRARTQPVQTPATV